MYLNRKPCRYDVSTNGYTESMGPWFNTTSEKVIFEWCCMCDGWVGYLWVVLYVRYVDSPGEGAKVG